MAQASDPRRYLAVAYLRTNFLVKGHASVALPDGTGARIYRSGGEWYAELRGEPVHTPQPTWETARNALEHALAAEGIWLRTLGS